ncbi:MAG: hypothetical protein K8U03_09630 [Planctomycetia bacterium]|nr:hypothetical protein [Planctomycetia bacterium]
MNNRLRLAVLVLFGGACQLLGCSSASAAPLPVAREIYVPFEELNVLLEGPVRRVLMSREEYEALLVKARTNPAESVPHQALLLSADYDVKIEDLRAFITAKLGCEVLADGLQGLTFHFGQVGIQEALLDGKPASLRRTESGELMLLLEGRGRHELTLKMVALLETNASEQTLQVQLPRLPASRLHVSAEGNVEVRGGAALISRAVDDKTGRTQLELVPVDGSMSLALSLNNRTRRKQRAVVARSVVIDEVTSAYERLHATVSLSILHQAIDRFRFAIPDGFEISDVQTPLLARWSTTNEPGRRILDVALRQETTEPVVLNIAAVRSPARLEAWTFPKLEPLDTVGQMAVVGLLLEDRLKAEDLAAEGMLPVDNDVLAQALPASVLTPEAGSPRVRPIVAYYAPDGAIDLKAKFTRPPARVMVTTNVLLTLREKGLEVRGGFALAPEAEALHEFDFTVPAGWNVTEVTRDNGTTVPFERYGPADAPRIHVRLPTKIAGGASGSVYFQAAHVPAAWLDAWTATNVEFPVFAVAGAAIDTGAVAVDAKDDLTIRPDVLTNLTPLDKAEQAKYGLVDVAVQLAYRYDSPGYRATIAVERTTPRITARTHSFFRIDADLLTAHYELAYDIARARTRRLEFVLPATTPAAVSLRGLDGVVLKEYSATDVPEGRLWRVLLSEAAQGRVRLAVDFQQPLSKGNTGELPLPVVRAQGVAYQSGVVAVEGNAEIDVQVVKHPRKVDVGELAEAEYQTGRRLLGAFGFVGDDSATTISVVRHPAYGLQPALVQAARYVTVLDANGRAQTSAEFQIRTKAGYLEVKLPSESTLWSVVLDGQTAQPQREGDRLLLSFPAAAGEQLRSLKVSYETEVAKIAVLGRIEIPALVLFLRATPGAAPQEVPMADARWELHLPAHYRVLRSQGTLTNQDLSRVERPAAANVVDFLFGLSGGFGRAEVYKSTAPSASVSALPTGEADRKPSDSYLLHDSDMLTNEKGDQAGARPEAKPQKPSESAAQTATTLARPTTPTPAAPPRVALPTSTSPRSTFTSAAPAPAAPTPFDDAAPMDKPAVAAKTSVAKQNKLRRPEFDLAGVRSLKIDLQSTNDVAVFESLGIDPRLDVTLVDERRADGIALVAALAVFLYGTFLSCRPRKRKLRYIAGVCLATTLLPLVAMRPEWIPLVNPSFYAACWLIPYYGFIRLLRWGCGKWSSCRASSATCTALGMLALSFTTSFAPSFTTTAIGAPPVAERAVERSAEPSVPNLPVVVQLAEPAPPVAVPDDATILLYQPTDQTGPPRAEQLLVPYERYQELWNRAYPQKRSPTPPPAPYSAAGAEFRSTLAGDAFLLVEGWIDYELFTDEFVQIPLPLAGGVLASALLDGKPARLTFAQAPEAPVPEAKPSSSVPVQQAKPAPSSTSAPLVLVASGKGRHRLELAVRLSLEKTGGWRIAEGRLPVAPAASLMLTVPQADTDIRLGGVPDRRNYTTTKPAETIATALGADGALRIEWRAKINETQIDESLKARSEVVFAVQDDGVRLAWRTALEFGATRRERFTVVVPPDYLVERVVGRNVRGWEPRDVDGVRKLDIELLRPASNSEEFAIYLSRRLKFTAAPTEFVVPVVGIEGAAVHNGTIAARRSSILDLRTLANTGLTRIDAIQSAELYSATADPSDVSPLGMRAYESYRFVAVPFSWKLSIVPLVAKSSAEANSILKIAERERRFETQIKLRVAGAPIHRFRAFLPDDLRLDQVIAPGTFEWAVTTVDGRSLLTVYFATGHSDTVELLLAGLLGKTGPTLTVPLPRLDVLDVERQEGHLVVQIDPAFDVEPTALRGCEQELLDRTFGWLREAQRPTARIALRYTSGDYAGTINLKARQPTVRCQTITNVRVTDRAIEETILLEFTIRDAGVREVAFQLPAALADAKIGVPQLREKKIEPIGTDGRLIRVRLLLQDEVMDQLRVLVESDRLRTSLEQSAPIPLPETGRIEGRFVTLEGFGRDELVVDKTTGLEPLGRQQQQWQVVAGLLRGGATQAYRVEPTAVDPQLTYTTRSRATVETVGARIGLAETTLVVDEFGAYRGVQTYRVDNKSEQFLVVELPQGSLLWTVWVAGEPVKPTPAPPPASAREVRIPLVKTAEGDLDYELKIVYGGKLASLQTLTKVDFPLVRTVNVKVELSQVRLYLPESFDWFDFGGTMKPVQEESVIQAGSLSYFNKSAEKLALTLERGDEFAKARASNSLRELKSDVGSFLGALSSSPSYSQPQAADGDLRQELLRNNELWKEAERKQQTHSAQALPPTNADTGAILSNSGTLNSTYEGQSNARSKNVVSAIGGNFGGELQPSPINAPAPTASPAGTSRFDAQWLARNGLANGSLANNGVVNGEVANSGPAGTGKPGEPKGVFTKSGAGTMVLGGVSNYSNAQPVAPQVAQGKAKESLLKDLAAQQEQVQMNQAEDRRGLAGGKQATAQRYQQRLSEQAKQPTPGRGVEGLVAGDGFTFEGSKDQLEAKAVQGGWRAAAAGAHAEFAGLAGLEVQIPKRGKLYRFTTPLGDARITARPVSASLIEDLTRLTAVVAGLIVLWVLWRLVRNRLAWFAESRRGALVVAAIGLLSITTQIAPLAGLLTLLTGFILLIRRFFIDFEYSFSRES